MSSGRDRPWFWAVGKCRPLSPRPLNRGESFCRATCKPPLRQVARRSERCLVCHRLASSSAANVKALDRADSYGKSVRFYPYLSRGGSFKPPKRLATARVRAAQHSRVASAPRRIAAATRAVLKLCPTGPAEPFAITFAPPREWLRVKDHVPPRTELHREGFKVLSSIQIHRRFMVSTSSPMSCGLRRNAFTPALRATASESVPDIINRHTPTMRHGSNVLH